MKTFVFLPLQERVAQHGACKQDRWRGYITDLVVNDGIVESIRILTAVIRLMIKFNVAKSRDYFPEYAKWTQAILYQLSTLSALDLDHALHLPHALLPEEDTYCLPEGNQWIPNTLWRIQSGGDHNALQCCPLLIELNGIQPYRLVCKPCTGLSM